MSRGFLPRQDVQFTGPTGRPTTPFYTWLQGLDAALKGGASVAEIQAEIDRLRQTIADIPTTGFLPDTTNVFGQNSVVTFGTLAGGVVLVELTGDVATPYPFQFYGVGSDRVRGWRWVYDALEAGAGLVQTMDGFNVVGVLGAVEDLPVSGTVGDAYLVAGHLWAWDGAAWVDEGDASGVTMFALAPLPDTGEGALLAITRDQYGRVEGTKDATITGTAGQVEVANGDAVAGLPTISLADLADAGGGAFKLLTRDAKGRLAGTSDGDTDDVPEGAGNLYFTDARTDARIDLQKGQPSGLATLDADAKLEANQLPALAITDTFVVASQAAMLALDAQQGDVAVRTDEEKSYILTAEPASTLVNWQELLTPTGTGGTVTSVGLSVPTGLTVSGSPITSSGTITVSYSAGYQGYTSSEASKLSGIASGATVGADWSVNLSNIPANIAGWASISPASKANDSDVVKLAGAQSIAGTKSFTSEVVAQSSNAVRFRNTTYSAFWRNDNNDLYLMLTNAGDPDGGWNSFRPIVVNFSTGDVRLGPGASVGTNLIWHAGNMPLSSGTYTPSTTGIANVASVSGGLSTYSRVGNSVVLSGRVDVTPSAAGVFTTVEFSIPVNSNFTSGAQASGGGSWNQSTTAMGSALVGAGGGANVLRLSFIPANTSNHTVRYTINYPVL